MADSDFEFDEFFEQINGEGDTFTTTDTRNPSNTRTTSNTLHPFSVRLDQEYIEVIKALAWWKRISQREFIEQTVNQYLDGIESEELKDILNQYHKNN